MKSKVLRNLTVDGEVLTPNEEAAFKQFLWDSLDECGSFKEALEGWITMLLFQG